MLWRENKWKFVGFERVSDITVSDYAVENLYHLTRNSNYNEKRGEFFAKLDNVAFDKLSKCFLRPEKESIFKRILRLDKNV